MKKSEYIFLIFVVICAIGVWPREYVIYEFSELTLKRDWGDIYVAADAGPAHIPDITEPQVCSVSIRLHPGVERKGKLVISRILILDSKSNAVVMNIYNPARYIWGDPAMDNLYYNIHTKLAITDYKVELWLNNDEQDFHEAVLLTPTFKTQRYSAVLRVFFSIFESA